MLRQHYVDPAAIKKSPKLNLLNFIFAQEPPGTKGQIIQSIHTAKTTQATHDALSINRQFPNPTATAATAC